MRESGREPSFDSGMLMRRVVKLPRMGMDGRSIPGSGIAGRTANVAPSGPRCYEVFEVRQVLENNLHPRSNTSTAVMSEAGQISDCGL